MLFTRQCHKAPQSQYREIEAQPIAPRHDFEPDLDSGQKIAFDPAQKAMKTPCPLDGSGGVEIEVPVSWQLVVPK